MQVRPGSLLIANPANATQSQIGHVVYVSESTDHSTMGIILNAKDAYSLSSLLSQKGIDWPEDTRVSIGGDYSPTCLIMLHTNEWYSTNTMPVDQHLSISSDHFMLEKIETGNTPDWYKLVMGTSGWTPQELEYELKGKKPKWSLLSRPSQKLIHSSPSQMWDMAVAELSQDVFSNYI